MQPVIRRKKQDRRRAFSVFFKNPVLDSDETVAEFIYFQAAGAKVEERIVPVWREDRRVRGVIARKKRFAFGVIDIGRLTKAAVPDERQL